MKLLSILLVSVCTLLPVYAQAEADDSKQENVVSDSDLTDDGGMSSIADDLDDAAQQVGNKISDTATTVGTALTDSLITLKIKGLLAKEQDIPADISVTTKDSVVYLDGKVATDLQADRAIELARSVDGVLRVDSTNLTVISSDNYMSDAMLTLKAKMEIAKLSRNDQIANEDDLSVESTNGEVHIFGKVGDDDDIATIIDAIAKIDGVKSVHTNISVVD